MIETQLFSVVVSTRTATAVLKPPRL